MSDTPEVTPLPIKKDKEEEELPSLPKRPVSPFTKLKGELTEAFPNLEDKLITAIMILSQGQLDQSFNALLYYNDPSTLSEEEVKSLFRPKLPSRNSATSQLQQDEAMAKKLAKKYSKQERYNRYLLDNDKEDNGDSFESFLENDLPQLKQQLNKNLEETSTKISNWFGNLNKKFNEGGNNQGQALFSAIGGGAGAGGNSLSIKKQNSRPSTSSSSNVPTSSRSRYDYDSESIVNQTDGITLNDNTNEDIYGTPKAKKNSFETTGSGKEEPIKLAKPDDVDKKTINAIKPEPILLEDKSNLKTGEDDLKKANDDDFLVDDSDED